MRCRLLAARRPIAQVQLRDQARLCAGTGRDRGARQWRLGGAAGRSNSHPARRGRRAGSGKARRDIEEQFEQFAKDNPNNVTGDTLNQSRKTIRLLAESLPPRTPASKLDKRAIREFSDLLREWPIRAGEITEFRGKPIREVVELNKTLEQEGDHPQDNEPPPDAPSPRSPDGLSSAASSTAKNPTNGLFDRIDKRAEKSRAYTPQNCSGIFSSPIFTGYLSDEKDDLPGSCVAMIGASLFSFPLLAPLHGRTPRRAGTVARQRRAIGARAPVHCGSRRGRRRQEH